MLRFKKINLNCDTSTQKKNQFEYIPTVKRECVNPLLKYFKIY